MEFYGRYADTVRRERYDGRAEERGGYEEVIAVFDVLDLEGVKGTVEKQVLIPQATLRAGRLQEVGAVAARDAAVAPQGFVPLAEEPQARHFGFSQHHGEAVAGQAVVDVGLRTMRRWLWG